MRKHTRLHPDSKVIDRLGGPSKLAEELGYSKTAGGAQRIQNWRKRGIPAAVKLARPDLFLTDLIESNRTAGDAQHPVGGSERSGVLP